MCVCEAISIEGGEGVLGVERVVFSGCLSLPYWMESAKNFLFSLSIADGNFSLDRLILKQTPPGVLLGFHAMITSDKFIFQDCLSVGLLHSEKLRLPLGRRYVKRFG